MPMFDPRQGALRGEPSYFDEPEEYQPQEPEAALPPNPFTPIQVPEHLGGGRIVAGRPLNAPPPTPGQLYAFDVVDQPQPVYQPTEQDYQKMYWQTLRQTAPQIEQPAPVPPYVLPPMQAPVLYDEPPATNPYDQPMNNEGYGYAQPVGNEAYQQEYGYAQPAGNEAYQQEYGYEPVGQLAYRSQPVQQPAPYAPRPKRTLRELADRTKDAYYTAVAPKGYVYRRGQPARVSKLRLAGLVGVTLAILGCILMMISILQSMETAEKANREWRESYYAGAAATEPGDLVRLPSGGATFAPNANAATAAPAPTPTPPPRIEIADNLVGVDLSTPTPAASLRTVRASYQGNPQLIILERFAQLRAQNRFIVGWLTMGELDCPVMQHSNKTYYQTHDAAGQYSEEGAIYLDSAVSLKTPPENLVLYGNNNASGTMFAQLMNYAQLEYLRLYPVIKLDTLYEDGEFVVFAVIKADTNPASPAYFSFSSYLTFPSDKAFTSYIAAALRRSLYTIGVDVGVGDELLTLSTQGDSGATSRLVVLCRRLRAGESPADLSLTMTMKEEN